MSGHVGLQSLLSGEKKQSSCWGRGRKSDDFLSGGKNPDPPGKKLSECMCACVLPKFAGRVPMESNFCGSHDRTMLTNNVGLVLREDSFLNE